MNTFTVTAGNGITFRFNHFPAGEHPHYPSKATVDIYDTRYPHTQFGQFVASHFVQTIHEITGGLNLNLSVADWRLDQASVTEAQDWLKALDIAEKARQELQSEYRLVSVRDGARLTSTQVGTLLRGKDPEDSGEFESLLERHDELRREGAQSVLRGILYEQEYELLCTAGGDFLDDLRTEIGDRDIGDPIDELLANTGHLLIRYRIDCPIDTSCSSSEAEWGEQADEILQMLGLTGSDADNLRGRIIRDLLPQSGDGGQLSLLFMADVHRLVHDIAETEEDRRASQAAEITLPGAGLLILDRLNGAGFEIEIPGPVTVAFDSSRLLVDLETSTSWTSIVGGFRGDHLSEVTITVRDPKPASESIQIAAHRAPAEP